MCTVTDAYTQQRTSLSCNVQLPIRYVNINTIFKHIRNMTTPNFTSLLQTLRDISPQNKTKNTYDNLRVTPSCYLPFMKKKP